jgi:hypothetical protein
MDFGSGTWKGARPITESLMAPNTPEYRSPEALRFLWKHWDEKGARYEAHPADDMYALAVAVYRLLTRVYPPPGTAPEELKSQLQAPAERRLPARALNERVVPALSDLAERMLDGNPEARISAREVAEAAEAATGQLGPEADVPLFGAERPAAGHVPARGGAEPRKPSWGLRLRVAAVSGSLLLVAGSIWQMGPWPRMEPQSVRPGARTAGLGKDPLASREVAPEKAPEPASISRDMPRQPLPRQQRPPCRRSGEVALNGGCWTRQANIEAPCDDEEYEWQGACYRPVFDKKRPPTTKDPQ